MKIQRNKLVTGVQAALSVSALAAVGVAGNAIAQNTANTQNQQQPKTLQTVVVTGSHIRRVDVETENPVVNVTPQEIQSTGAVTVGDVIQRLPAITGGVQNPDVNNGGGGGATLVGLRGLGDSRTLILVDGQRILNKDLNNIPIAAIQKVEVLTSGASAVYGSDAIGGVINFILKRNYDGAQFSMNYGVSDHWDAHRRGAGFMFGHTSNTGSIIAGVHYNKFDPLLMTKRDVSKQLLSGSVSNGQLVVTPTGSTNAPRTYVSIPGHLATKFGCPTPNGQAGVLSLNKGVFDSGTTPVGPGDYHCFGSEPNDAYNFAAVNWLVTPRERTNAFFNGTFHLSDNVDFFATILHDKTTSVTQLAPAIFGTQTVNGQMISKDSFYNPFKVNFSAASGNLFRTRDVPGGDRVTHSNSTSDEVLMGFRGDAMIMGRNWTWDIGLDYGHRSRTLRVGGLPNEPQLVKALGPSFLNDSGMVQCGTPSAPISLGACTPFDLFNTNSAGARKALAAAATTGVENFWSIERIEHADASGGLFDLPAGTAQLAFGFLHRTEYTDNAIDPVLLINPETGAVCTLGSECGAHLQGGFNVKEAYAELFVPILKNMPLAHGLSITLGDRYSKYNTFGTTTNWKIGVEYRPIQELLLRGTVSRVFRAPTVSDIFSSPSSSAPFLGNDPCNHITVANPACKGVPLDGSFFDSVQTENNPGTPQQLLGVDEGAKAAGLKIGPETGKSFDFGVVWSPRWVSGLSMSLDFWRIYLNNTIGQVGVGQELRECFNGVTKFCGLVQRVTSGTNAGQIIRETQVITNLGRIDVKGSDLSVNYRLPTLPYGQFTIGLHATYLTQFKIQTAPGEPFNTVVYGQGKMGGNGSKLSSVCPFSVSGLCFLPRIRARAHLRWQLGSWNAQWTMRYIKSWDMATQSGFHIEGLDHYGSYVYNDLMVGYDIQPINTRVNVGINNVFEKKPPLLFQSRTLNGNTDPEDFDILGRYYWARVIVSF